MDMDMDMGAKIQRYRDTCIHGHALKATMGVTIAEWKRGCVKCINFNPQVLPLQPLWEMVGFLGVRVNGKIPRIDWGTPLKFFSVVKDLLMKLSFPIFPHPRAKVTSLNMHSWVLFQNISLPISSSLTRKKSSWKLTWNLKTPNCQGTSSSKTSILGGSNIFQLSLGCTCPCSENRCLFERSSPGVILIMEVIVAMWMIDCATLSSCKRRAVRSVLSWRMRRWSPGEMLKMVVIVVKCKKNWSPDLEVLGCFKKNSSLFFKHSFILGYTHGFKCFQSYLDFV